MPSGSEAINEVHLIKYEFIISAAGCICMDAKFSTLMCCNYNLYKELSEWLDLN